MAVVLPASALDGYRRFSLYNSPFPAHDRGCAIDLYPHGERAPSPVAGTVVDTRTVRAPPKPYAAEHDHLIVVDAGDRLARLLHVDPVVAAGDEVNEQSFGFRVVGPAAASVCVIGVEWRVPEEPVTRAGFASAVVSDGKGVRRVVGECTGMVAWVPDRRGTTDILRGLIESFGDPVQPAED
jgi:hypothetical protein